MGLGPGALYRGGQRETCLVLQTLSWGSPCPPCQCGPHAPSPCCVVGHAALTGHHPPNGECRGPPEGEEVHRGLWAGRLNTSARGWVGGRATRQPRTRVTSKALVGGRAGAGRAKPTHHFHSLPNPHPHACPVGRDEVALTATRHYGKGWGTAGAPATFLLFGLVSFSFFLSFFLIF